MAGKISCLLVQAFYLPFNKQLAKLLGYAPLSGDQYAWLVEPAHGSVAAIDPVLEARPASNDGAAATASAVQGGAAAATEAVVAATNEVAADAKAALQPSAEAEKQPAIAAAEAVIAAATPAS
jgi:hypothetical protein